MVSPDLTPDEQRNVRAALAYLRAKVGTWETLGKLLRFEPSSLVNINARRKVASPTLTFRVARLAGVKIDDLLAGKYPPKGTCERCGHVQGADGAGVTKGH